MNFTKYLLFACLAILSLLPFMVMAATPLPSVERDIQQQQRERLEQAERQRESLQQQQQIDLAPNREEIASGPCYAIEHITFRGASQLSAEQQRAIVAPYEGRCLTLTAIQSLVNDITNIYAKRGLITSRAWLQEQDVSSGRLTIDVQEGRIGGFQYDEQPKRSAKMAFPGLTGEVLNLRDLEQGIEQLNRLTTRPVTIDIQPGERSGYSLVHLKSMATRLPVKASIGVDNSGQKTTGRGQINGGLTWDSPLGLLDQWRVSGSHNNDIRHDRRSRQLSAGITQPYGYWLFNYGYGWNDSLQTMTFGDSRYRYTGSTETHRIGAERVLYRDGVQKLSASAGLTRRKTTNHLAGELLSISSPTLTVADVGLSWSRTLGGGYFTLNPGFSQGLSAIGSTKDDASYGAAPRAQFHKVTLTSSYFYPINESLTYLTSFFAQATPYALYSSEQVSAGGQYSVRGYQDRYLTGNRGGYWRQELSWQMKTIPFLGELSLIGAVDAGWIDREGHKISGGTLSGIAGGLNLTGEWLSQSLQLAAPLSSPAGLHPDRVVVYWQAALTI